MLVTAKYLFKLYLLSLLFFIGSCNFLLHNARTYLCALAGGCSINTAVATMGQPDNLARITAHIHLYEENGGCYKRVLDRLQPVCDELVDNESKRQECMASFFFIHI